MKTARDTHINSASNASSFKLYMHLMVLYINTDPSS